MVGLSSAISEGSINFVELEIVSVVIALIHLCGVIAAIDAIYLGRSAQGATAWATFLVAFPYVGLPAYWIFGRSRFHAYRELIYAFGQVNKKQTAIIQEEVRSFVAASPALDPVLEKVLEKIAGEEFSASNEIDLLIDGKITFASMFEAISSAKNYILVQFYIVRDDRLGREFGNALIERAQQGIKVFVLYDEIGSSEMNLSFISELRAAGIEIVPFGARTGFLHSFQLNFRNHRKIVVVDGKVGFLGGLNIGDEYVGRGRYRRLAPWRDTFLKLAGPAVIPLQVSFSTDWIWATGAAPALDWNSAPTKGDKDVLIFRPGPSDDYERCVLFFLEIIRTAKKRLWIASPYFVPDEPIVTALQLAAMRGVDVRLLLPERADHWLVWFAGFSYLPEIIPFGVRVFHYKSGFLHEKVFVLDEEVCGVGTANLDNRSLRLNFEIVAVIANKEVTSEVVKMFETDFANSDESRREYLDKMSLRVRVLSRFARLFAPVL